MQNSKLTERPVPIFITRMGSFQDLGMVRWGVNAARQSDSIVIDRENPVLLRCRKRQRVGALQNLAGFSSFLQSLSAVVFVILVLLGLVLGAGCSSVGPLSRSDAEAINRGEKTIVLIRTDCLGDEPRTAAHPAVGATLWRLDGPNGEPEVSPPRIVPSLKKPSKLAAEEGWRYMLLPPGNYYAEISGRAPGATASSSNTRYYFPVSPRGHVAYAGTVLFRQNTFTVTNRSKSGRTSISIAQDGIRNDQADAEQLARKEFAEFSGDVSSYAMVPYDDLKEVLASLSSEDTRTRMESAGHPAQPRIAVEGDSTSAAAIAAAPLWIPGYVLVAGAGNSSGGDGRAVLLVGGAGLALMAAAVPVYGTAYGITVAVHRKRWAPYEAELKRQFEDSNFDQRLAESVGSRLFRGAAGVSATNGTAGGLVLSVEPYRVLLKGNDHQEFTLEIAVRIKLVDASTGTVRWQNWCVRTIDDKESFGPAGPYEVPFRWTPSLHPLKNYGEANGNYSIRAEMEAALSEISDEIVGRFKEARAVAQ